MLLLAVTCQAAELVFRVTAPGYYALVDGRLVPVQVVDVDPAGPVVPPPAPVTPPTPPDPVSADAKAVKASAQAAVADPTRAETAGNLAEVMKLVKSQIDAGTITTYQQIAAAANWLMDSIIGKQSIPWKPTKDLIGQRLAALGQQGAQPEEYSGFFADAADGFEASIPLSDLADRPQRINIETLMKLFEFFIKYILPFIIK
jgi:hypothetical protein